MIVFEFLFGNLNWFCAMSLYLNDYIYFYFTTLNSRIAILKTPCSSRFQTGDSEGRAKYGMSLEGMLVTGEPRPKDEKDGLHGEMEHNEVKVYTDLATPLYVAAEQFPYHDMGFCDANPHDPRTK